MSDNKLINYRCPLCKGENTLGWEMWHVMYWDVLGQCFERGDRPQCIKISCHNDNCAFETSPYSKEVVPEEITAADVERIAALDHEEE